jgi:hypothetical protein
MTTSILVKATNTSESAVDQYAPDTQGTMISPGYFKEVCYRPKFNVGGLVAVAYGDLEIRWDQYFKFLIANDLRIMEKYCVLEYVPPRFEVLPTPPAPTFTAAIDANAGWDAGAKTIAVYANGFYFRFSFGSGTVNTFVGLNAGEDKTTLPTEMPISVESNRGVLTLHYPGGDIVLGDTGNLATDNELVFTRDKDNIVRLTYKREGVVYPAETSPGVEWEYEYAGATHLEASIYLGGNQVILSEHYGISYASASINSSSTLFIDSTKFTANIKSRARVSAGLDSLYCRGNLIVTSSLVAPLRVDHRPRASIVTTSSITARFREGGDSQLSYLESMGADYFYASSEVDLPYLTVNSSDRLPAPSVIVGITSLAYLQGFGTGVVGTVGQAEGSLPYLVAGLSSDRPMAQAISELPYLTSYGVQVDEIGEASIFEGLFTQAYKEPQWDATDSAVDTLNIQTQLTSVREAYASILSQIDTNVNPVVILVTDSSAISTIIVTVSDQTESADSWASWVVNYETDAHWRYENFEYNSFATFNGKTFGCKDDGVYELTGASDAGTAIDAKITTPVSDFDNSFKKRMLKAYLGVKSDGDMVLKVLAEGGNVYYYGVDNTRSSVGGARVNIGRGLTSRYWQFELMNSDGADFELDAIEFFPVITSRREM